MCAKLPIPKGRASGQLEASVDGEAEFDSVKVVKVPVHAAKADLEFYIPIQDEILKQDLGRNGRPRRMAHGFHHMWCFWRDRKDVHCRNILRRTCAKLGLSAADIKRFGEIVGSPNFTTDTTFWMHCVTSIDYHPETRTCVLVNRWYDTYDDEFICDATLEEVTAAGFSGNIKY